MLLLLMGHTIATQTFNGETFQWNVSRQSSKMLAQ